MHYYIIDDAIFEIESPLDGSIYNYTKLSQEQSDFYELHNKNISITEVVTLTLNPPIVISLQDLKNELVNYLNDIFATRLSQGYEDEELGFKTCFEDVDRTQFSGLLVQYDNLEKLGQTIESVTISDYSKQFQSMTFLEFRGFIARFGAKYIELWSTKSYIESLIQNASDEETLDVIKTQIDAEGFLA